jgi:hypothetical protein
MMLHFQAEDVVRTWLEAICPSDEPSDSFVAERASEWAPATLKQIFTSVMSLGKAAGRLGESRFSRAVASGRLPAGPG